MCDMLDCSGTTNWPSGERPGTPDSVNPVCSAIHHDLSVVKELVHRSSITAQHMFDRVLQANHASE